MEEDEEEGIPAHYPNLPFQFNAKNPLSWEFVFGCSEEKATIRKLILVCIHGNEQCGMKAFNQLFDEGWISTINPILKQKNLRIRVILGNPRGVIENKRFIDLNLNRIFRSPFLNEKSSDMFIKRPYELSRMEYICKAIRWCDYLLDLHSTSADTPPFALFSDNILSERYATTFPVEYVIKDLSKCVLGTTLGFAKLLSKIGISVECGQHENPDSVEIALQIIKKYVTDIGEPSHNVLSCGKCQLVNKGFHYMKKIEAFQRVQYNEVLANDDNGAITCPFPQGAIIIMPTEYPIIGEEAWFWGEYTKSIDKAVQHERG